MFKRNIRPRFNIVVISALIIGASLQPLRAAPGTLANSPLFLSTIVEPNVFFTVDDSGSMDWNPILASGTGGLPTSEGLPFIDGRQRAYYMANVEMIDTKVGEILEALEEKGYLDDAVVVFTSDHGDCLTDHGHSQKWTMYDTITRMPMIVWSPAVAAGAAAAWVSNSCSRAGITMNTPSR